MMKSKYKVVFSTPALDDLREATQWYNAQQKGLGKKLVQDVKDVVDMIKRNPDFASVAFANIRTAACKMFPYSLHYEVDDAVDLVQVISVFHFSRRPYWL